MAIGKNGPTYQATEDLALMRVLPGMTVLVPADATQGKRMIETVFNHEGPVYIRAARPNTPCFTKDIPYEVGEELCYREGRDLTICGCGIQVWEALKVAEELASEGIESEVINAASVKPLDTKIIVESAKKTGKVVTIEDHQIVGGMGSAVTEGLASEWPVPIDRIGLNNEFGVSAEWKDNYTKFGLDRGSLKKKIKNFVESVIKSKHE